MSGWERPGWLVRVRRDAGSAPVGAGLLCTDRHILTCAHVVDPAMGTSPPGVVVDFPFAGAHEPMVARVVGGGWFPAAADGTGDIAVLELVGQAPTLPAPMRGSAGVTGHRFRATGFPAGHDGAVISTGFVVGPAEAQWLQLQAASALGFSLEAGFSGAPLWDEDAAAVVGIVVSRERARGSLGDPRTGYAIPIDVVERYWSGLRPWVGWRLDHDRDLQAHWAPPGRGAGWHFTGRRAAITRLVGWLHGPEPLHVVTGGPGSGKSSVLARLVAMADPLAGADIEEPRPAPGSISLAVRCTGLDLAGVCHALSRFHQPTTEPETLIWDVVERGEPMVLVVDALDEAVSESEARAIAVRLLRPLAEAGAQIGVKVLVATRRGHDDSLLRALGPAARVDLDDPEFFEPADIAGYAEQLLLAGTYRDAPAAAREVAEVIARRSRPSFLVAGLTARAWASRPTVDAGEQDFPADVDEAMREYLRRLPDPDRALALLRILAHGRNPGLTLDLWEAAAAAYLATVSRAEIDGLLRAAAAYLIEQRTAGGEPAVQVFHQALVDHLVAMDTSGLVERTIADVLAKDTEARGGWLSAREYARQHAVTHAAAAGGRLLADLVADPEFLVAAERGAVLRALRTGQATTVATVYRAAAHALSDDLPTNAAHLELAARRAGADDLAERIRSVPLAPPFTTRAVSQPARLADQLTLTGHKSGITALTWGVVGGRPVLVSGAGDGTVILWDPADGSLLDSFDGDGEVSSLGWVDLDGTIRLAAARTDSTVAVWDRLNSPQVVRLADADGLEAQPWQGAIETVPPDLAGSSWHQDRIVTRWGTLAGAPILVHGYDDGSARGWRVDGTPVFSLRAHLWGGAVEWGELDGRPVLVTAGNDEVVTSAGDTPPDRAARWYIGPNRELIGHGRAATVRFWDPVRRVVNFARTMDDELVSACALAGSLLAMACDDDHVRVVDLADGRELVSFPGQGPLAWAEADGVTVLACAAAGHTVQVWDPRKALRLHTFAANDTVSALAWSDHGGRPVLASAGQSGRIQLWPWPAQEAPTAPPPSPVRALSWLAEDGRAVLAAGSSDGKVHIVGPASPVTFTAYDSQVSRVAWGRHALATATYEGDVAVWDPATGRQLLALPRHEEYLRLLSWVRLGDRELLAVASEAADLRLWSLDGEQMAVDLPRVGMPVRFLALVVTGEALSVLCGVCGELRFYDPVTWEERYWLHQGARPADLAVETCLATSFVDGTPVTARGGKDGRLLFWYPRGGFSMFEPVDAHDGPVLAMAWGRSEDTAAMLASGGRDGRVLLWDMRDPAEPEVLGVIAAYGPVNALAWHQLGDKEVLVVGTATGHVDLYGGPEEFLVCVKDLGSPVTALTTVPEDPEQVIVIGTAGGELWLLFQAGEPTLYQLSVGAEVSALAWSYWPDGWPVLAIGLADGSASLWDPRRTVTEDGTWYVDDPATIRAMAPATAMPVPVTTLSWGPDGPPTLFAGSADGMVRTWDVTEDAETHAFNADRLADSVLATGLLNGRAVLASAGGRLRIWDIAAAMPVVVDDEQGQSPDELLFGEIDGRTVLIQHTHDGIRVGDPLREEPSDTVAAPRQAERTTWTASLTRLSPEAIGVAAGFTVPVVAFGTLNGQPSLAIGTAAGLITLVDLRDDTRRTIDWHNPVHALAIGPDNLLAIGDPQGYTIIEIS